MKVTVKGILHLEQWVGDRNVDYNIHPSDMSGCTSQVKIYAKIKPVEVVLEIPDDFDPRPEIVAGLRKKKSEIIADAHMQANKIDEQIQQLLCLENKAVA